MKKLVRKIKLWLTNTKMYEYALAHIIPYIRFTTYYTSMKGKTYHNAYRLLKPGHIILTIDKKKLTTFLIPGDFSHAALCISKDRSWEVSEMTHTDYTKSTFADVCFQADRVVILECKDFDDKYVTELIRNCRAFEGTKYDIKFEMGVKALSCAELIYASDIQRRLDVSLEDVAGLGTLYISPDGLYKAKNCKVIYDTDWENNEEDIKRGDRG